MSLLDIIMRARFDCRQRNIDVRELHLHPQDWHELAKDMDAYMLLRTAHPSRPRGPLGELDGVDIFSSQYMAPGTFLLMPIAAVVDWRCKVHDDCKEHLEMARECALRT